MKYILFAILFTAVYAACPIPVITHGIDQSTYCGTTAGSFCTVECALGYEVAGNSTITCEADGTWSTVGVFPTCVDYNECTTCGDNTVCVNRQGVTVPVCDCVFGFVKDSFGDCVDYNECVKCGQFASCNNTVGVVEAYCYCESGYYGDASAPKYSACSVPDYQCIEAPGYNHSTPAGGCNTKNGTNCTYSCDEGYRTAANTSTFSVVCELGQWVGFVECEAMPVAWDSGVWSECSKYYCGSGVRSRTVSCVRSDGVVVADSMCTTTKPVTEEACNTIACNTTLVADGGECNVSADCIHNECYNGDSKSVCCETLCDAPCHACDLPGSEGRCVPVPAGYSGTTGCNVGATCGNTGQCGAGGVCVQAAAGVSCSVTAVCKNGKISGGNFTCTGTGQCDTTPTTCAPYKCTSTPYVRCYTTCSITGDCDNGYFCKNSQCVLELADGAACEAGDVCKSGVCAAEGVCCKSACTEPCKSCKVPGLFGQCAPIMSGTTPRLNSTFCNNDGRVCGPIGYCDGTGTCANKEAGYHCGDATCTGFTYTPASVCEPTGTGSCVTPANTLSCAPYVCGSTNCLTSCSVNSDCVYGAHCSGSSCKYDNAVPVIISYSNNTGPFEGGTRMTVVVESEIADVSTARCKFDGIITTALSITNKSFICVSPSRAAVTASSPEASQHSATVYFSDNKGVTWSDGTARFTYYVLPSVKSADPELVPLNGLGGIYLTGGDFPRTISGQPVTILCYFNDVVTTGTYTSATQAYCKVPMIATESFVHLSVSVDNGAYKSTSNVAIHFIAGAPDAPDYVHVDPNTDPVTTTEPTDSGGSSWIIIAVIAVVALGGGAAGAFVFMNKTAKPKTVDTEMNKIR